jgi:hypothetical protein
MLNLIRVPRIQQKSGFLLGSRHCQFSKQISGVVSLLNGQICEFYSLRLFYIKIFRIFLIIVIIALLAGCICCCFFMVSEASQRRQNSNDPTIDRNASRRRKKSARRHAQDNQIATIEQNIGSATPNSGPRYVSILCRVAR